MALTDMKLTKKQSKEMASPVPSMSEKYPWGLGINLDTEALNKLKLDISKRKVGDPVKIVAQGEVVEIRHSEEYGRDDKNIRIQMQKIDLAFNSSSKDDLDWNTPKDKAESILHKRGKI